MKRPGTVALLISAGALVGLGLLMATDHGAASSGKQVPLSQVLSSYIAPRSYVCYQTSAPLQLDGRLDKPAWERVPWTEDFVDIEGAAKPAPRLRTRAKMLWDDHFLYVGAELTEPHVWATVTQHDAVIFNDNDFEIFIDPSGEGHGYAEFEMNALNTTWDLLLPMPYKDQGMPVNRWESGVRTAVHVDGPLNDPTKTGKGWTVEVAFPWEALKELTRQAAPPNDGGQWRIDFSRVEWPTEIVDGHFRKIPGRSEDNWVWSAQGVVDMHRPETWGYVQFSTASPGSTAFRPDAAGPAKHLLHAIYYAEKAFRKDHGRWARSLEELGLIDDLPRAQLGPPRLETTSNLFEVSIALRSPAGAVEHWHIRQDAKTWSD